MTGIVLPLNLGKVIAETTSAMQRLVSFGSTGLTFDTEPLFWMTNEILKVPADSGVLLHWLTRLE